MARSPFTIPLQTQRLTLTLPDIGNQQDLEAHLNFICLEAVARNLARVPHPYPDGELPKRYALWVKAHEENENDQTFLIRETATGDLVGSCGFQLDKKGTLFEPGYVLAPHVWGQGYATEALHALVCEGIRAFPTVQEVFSNHYADNPASGRVMEKIGMRFSHDEALPCLARGPGTYPAKVLSLPKDSPIWTQSR